MMRVIAGQYRGRPLKTPEGADTRPILDRVKGSLFDWLGARLALPGQLPPVNVCDLFCGAGSQGIEALSRGARYCAFVDSSAAALKCLRENLANLNIRERFAIIPRPAEKVSITPPDRRGFDIVFFDPPFPLSGRLDPDSVMGRVIARIGREIPVTEDALLLWRHDSRHHLPHELPGGWTATDRREWGANAITLYEQTGDRAP